MTLLLLSIALVLCAHSVNAAIPTSSSVSALIALKQRNFDELERHLYSVSDSSSSSYTSHLSAPQLRQLIGPDTPQITRVLNWLSSHGVDVECEAHDLPVHPSSLRHHEAGAQQPNVVVYASGDWLSIRRLPAHLAEDFANLHRSSDLAHSYHAPMHLIDFLLIFPFQPTTHTHTATPSFVHAHPHRRHGPRIQFPLTAASSGTPAAQRAAYGVPSKLQGTNSTNVQMVWGTGTYGYQASDLNKYYRQMGIAADEIDLISTQGFPGVVGGDNFGEATLDVSLISGLAPGIRTIVANTDNSSSTEEGEGFGPAFLAFLADLNNLPNYDEAPRRQTDDDDDVNSEIDLTLPLVLSISLGSLSWDGCNLLCTGAVKLSQGTVTLQQCHDYMQKQRQVCMYPDSAQIDRMNSEFAKLGARGVSILAATGDGGSHFSFKEFGTDKIGKLLNQLSCQYNLPTFPAESPYVTGVGGTTWSGSGASPSSPIAWSASGSGFSWRFPRPSYQDDDVTSYLTKQKLPPSTSFNQSNRGYPDVAALAVNVPVVFNGILVGAGGTSASAPEFSALVSLINDARLNDGLRPLGFLNPRLYSLNAKHAGELFYDMSVGNSNCGSDGYCCSTGFTAAKGWDPTTGLGSPKFDGLFKYLSTNDA